jgi:Ca2+-binding RTX toxin-like protein
VSNLTGVIRFSNPIGSTATTGATGETNYRLMATEAFTVTDANPRDATPAAVGGNLKIASFNVLNFFTTMNTITTTNETNPIDDMWLGLDSRGANNNTEFLRQQDKLIGTLVTMNADVVTLIELENDFRTTGNTNASVAPGANGLTAIQFIVDGMNARLGAGTYDWVRPGSDALGGDAISVGMIYKTATVQVAPGTVVARLVDTDEVGGTEPDATTTDLADLGLTGLLTNTPGLGIFEGGSTSRVPLATTFQEIASGETFTVVGNHFKSKSPGSPAAAGDQDTGTGTGQWNQQRVEAATAVAAWINTNPTGGGDGRYVLVGDLNAYALEQPLQYLQGQGFTNLATQFIGTSAYSYVFDGLLGTLDYGLASAGFVEFFTGATDWHINSDEADSFDYNTDFKPASQLTLFDATTPIRTSDHDPFIMGLDLAVNFARFGNSAMTGTRETGTKLFATAGTSATSGDGIDVLTEAALGNIGTQSITINNLTVRADGAVFDAIFTLAAGIANFTARGTANVDITGNSIANTLIGSLGNNSLTGGDGDDFLIGSSGNDTLAGDAGFDYAAYFGTTGVNATINGTSISGADTDQLSGIEGLFGSEGNDTLTGDSGTLNALYGNGGDDEIDGGAGVDYISGGSGADVLRGGGGNDTIDGGIGDDIVYGGADRDLISYSDATGGVYVDLSGIDNGGGSDFAIGQGLDALFDIEDVAGSDFSDQLIGGSAANLLLGGAGDDVLRGKGGSDSLEGGFGTDHLLGGAGSDLLTGGSGQDFFYFDLPTDGVDTVSDWRSDNFDVLVVYASGFDATLATGAYLDAAGNAGRFVNGTVADQAFGQFLWDSATSTLAWDADGTGTGTATGIVTLTGITTLTAADILIL